MRRVMIGVIAACLCATFLGGCSTVPLAAADAPLPAGPEAAAPSSPGWGHKALLYLPNRVLDVLDVVSVSVALPSFPKNWLAGFLHVNAHATRAIQVGAGNTNENINLGLGYKRQLFPWFEEKYELAAGPLTFCKFKISQGNDKTDFGKAGVLLPTDEPFQKDLMDYWGVGAEVTFLPVGVKAEVHPVEIADLLLGFFFIDILKDDF